MVDESAGGGSIATLIGPGLCRRGERRVPDERPDADLGAHCIVGGRNARKARRLSRRGYLHRLDEVGDAGIRLSGEIDFTACTRQLLFCLLDGFYEFEVRILQAFRIDRDILGDRFLVTGKQGRGARAGRLELGDRAFCSRLAPCPSDVVRNNTSKTRGMLESNGNLELIGGTLVIDCLAHFRRQRAVPSTESGEFVAQNYSAL
ncbi:hypothetical protein [Methylomicrobium lacus]|uniref:hypothetical protein n=1 Tax=Methylomicrobium lacus TaxID=136992 RepID=UPI0018E07292|nr:hypothetical protein [Methylomicrobium lacus]